jgi:UDP-hydrolysing UDP-N-acetyl-D-glucosamine 2-epimerase
MRRTIGVVTVARSDYGHLRPLLAAIHASPALDLLLFVGGSHLAARFGRTAALVEADGWPLVAEIDMALDSDAPGAVARSIGLGVTGFAAALEKHRPDILVVLGDRFEMLSAGVAALPLRVPVAHLHGGEVTEAAIDEQIRHALAKLSHLHFPAAEPYARRLRQMGEEPWRIHCCGAPGLDRFLTVPALTRAALAERLGVTFERPLLIVTYHPETLDADPAGHIGELLAALERVDAELVITYPGADPGSHAILDRLQTFVADRTWARLASSLGDDVYCALLREADAMVGNSSSGLIEAPSFALPAVNIGDRQRGRVRAPNVIDVSPDRDQIAAAIARALDPAFRASLAGIANPYGDGRAAPRIAAVLRDVELGPPLLRKRFTDLPTSAS